MGYKERVMYLSIESYFNIHIFMNKGGKLNIKIAGKH